MTIAFSGTGGTVNGTTALVADFGGTITAPVAGDLLLFWMANKYPPNGPATPTDWFLIGQVSGGAGSSGADQGNVYATCFGHYVTASEQTLGVYAPTTFTITSGNSATGRASLWKKDAVNTWQIDIASGSQNSQNTSWSVVMGSDPGLMVNDLVQVISAVNGDVGGWSAQAIVVSGVTFGTVTERLDNGTSMGEDCRANAVTVPVTAGLSSGVATYTGTISSSTGSFCPAGSSLLVRLREVGRLGTASITEGADTTSSAGTVLISGAVSITEADDTLSSTGTFVVSGAASITEADDTLSSAGAVLVSGDASIIEDADTTSSTGMVLVSGDASITEADDTLFSEGMGAIFTAGEALIVEADDTLSSTGTVLVLGEASITEADDTTLSAGTVLVSGDASIVEDADTVSAEGGVQVSAESAVVEADDTLSSTGTILISGDAAITEDADTTSSAGTVFVSGDASINEADDTTSSDGTVLVFGTASITEFDDTLSSTGEAIIIIALLAGDVPSGAWSSWSGWFDWD